jgi:hypothetical protein
MAQKPNLLQVNVTEKMKKDIQAVMAQEDKLMPEIIREAIEMYLKNYKKNN